VKRLLREAFWASEERLPAGHDFVVVARADAGELAESEGLAGIRTELDQLLQQAGAGK
jgi:ribonuclease P protein component